MEIIRGGGGGLRGAVVAGVLGWAAFAQAVTVVNGSFEENATDGGSTYQPLYEGFGGLPGWRFSTSPRVVLIGTPDSVPPYAYATPYGRWQLDLSGSDNGTGGWIETEVTGLVAGGRYEVRFSLGTSRDFLASGGAPAVRVTLDGGQAGRYEHLPVTTVEWTAQVHRFVAGGATAVLRFTDVAPTGTGLVSIDRVEVLEVQEVPTVGIRRLASEGGVPRVEVVYAGVLEASVDLEHWQAVGTAVSPWVTDAAGGWRYFRARTP